MESAPRGARDGGEAGVEDYPPFFENVVVRVTGRGEREREILSQHFTDAKSKRSINPNLKYSKYPRRKRSEIGRA